MYIFRCSQKLLRHNLLKNRFTVKQEPLAYSRNLYHHNHLRNFPSWQNGSRSTATFSVSRTIQPFERLTGARKKDRRDQPRSAVAILSPSPELNPPVAESDRSPV